MDLNEIAEDALHEACAFMQKQIDAKTGDLAAQFFSVKNGDAVTRIFRNYLETEMQWKAYEKEQT